MSWGWTKIPGPSRNLISPVAPLFFFAYLLYSFLLSPYFFSFSLSIPFIWSEAAGLLCFPESHLRSCWHLEGRGWQGSWRQWNSKLNNSYYLSLSGKHRPFGFVFLFFTLNISFHLGKYSLGQNPGKKMITFFASVFWSQTAGWNWRLSKVPGKQGSCSMWSKTFRKEKLYRERAVLEWPQQQGLQLVFAFSHETEMHPKPGFLTS